MGLCGCLSSSRASGKVPFVSRDIMAHRKWVVRHLANGLAPGLYTVFISTCKQTVTLENAEVLALGWWIVWPIMILAGEGFVSSREWEPGYSAPSAKPAVAGAVAAASNTPAKTSGSDGDNVARFVTPQAAPVVESAAPSTAGTTDDENPPFSQSGDDSDSEPTPPPAPTRRRAVRKPRRVEDSEEESADDVPATRGVRRRSVARKPVAAARKATTKRGRKADPAVCSAVLASGARAGQACGRKAKANGLCGIHGRK